MVFKAAAVQMCSGVDPARNAVAVQRAHGVERLQHHQVERPLHDLRLFSI